MAEKPQTLKEEQEAIRLKNLSLSNFNSENLNSALNYANQAYNLSPNLPGINQLLTTLNILISAKNPIKNSTTLDFYDILGLTHFSPLNLIKAQYKKIVFLLNSDENLVKDAVNEAVEIVEEAYRVLSDKGRRMEYDGELRLAVMEENCEESGVIGRRKAVGEDGLENWEMSSLSELVGKKRKVKSVSEVLERVEVPVLEERRRSCREKVKRDYRKLGLGGFGVEEEVEMSRNDEEMSENDEELTLGEMKMKSLRKLKGRKDGGKGKGRVGIREDVECEAEVQEEEEEVMKLKSLRKAKGRKDVEKRNVRIRDEVEIEDEEVVMKSKSSRNTQGRKDGEKRNVTVNEEEAEAEEEEVVMMESLRKSKGRKDGGRKSLISREEEGEEEEEEVIKSKSSRKEKRRKDGGKRNLNIREEVEDVDEEEERVVMNKRRVFAESGDLEVMTVEDSDFYDFDKDRVERSFKTGQVWAIYDDDDGMPRHFGLIDEVVSVNPFVMKMSWLDFQNDGVEELICWEKSGFHVSCGKFKVARKDVVKLLNIFSHLVQCDRIARELYLIYPRKGSIWALYKESTLDVEGGNSPRANQRDYDIVLFLTSYSEVYGLHMVYLEKVNGYKTVFTRREFGYNAVRWIKKIDVRLFSHQIPARKLTGDEAPKLSGDCWELDPASLPQALLAINM